VETETADKAVPWEIDALLSGGRLILRPYRSVRQKGNLSPNFGIQA
jgi:hypothetical protein